MSTTLYDDVWKRQGISLVWSPEALATVCRSDQVISLHRFFQLSREDWPEDGLDTLMVADGRALVVAGLESALDMLPPDKVTEWIEMTLYPVLRSYQQAVADGGRGASLIFWIAVPNRFVSSLSTDPFVQWIARDRTEVEITRALFNGAADDVRSVVSHDADGKTIGLYHPRIS